MSSSLPLVQIGDIAVYPDVIVTPSGTTPIAGLTWTVRDLSTVQERISPAGIILAVLFVWVCLLGLLFLLMKEVTVSGYVEVTVHRDGFHHLTQIPITSKAQVAPIHSWVAYARSLSLG